MNPALVKIKNALRDRKANLRNRPMTPTDTWRGTAEVELRLWGDINRLENILFCRLFVEPR